MLKCLKLKRQTSRLYWCWKHCACWDRLAATQRSWRLIHLLKRIGSGSTMLKLTRLLKLIDLGSTKLEALAICWKRIDLSLLMLKCQLLRQTTITKLEALALTETDWFALTTLKCCFHLWWMSKTLESYPPCLKHFLAVSQLSPCSIQSWLDPNMPVRKSSDWPWASFYRVRISGLWTAGIQALMWVFLKDTLARAEKAGLTEQIMLDLWIGLAWTKREVPALQELDSIHQAGFHFSGCLASAIWSSWRKRVLTDQRQLLVFKTET